MQNWSGKLKLFWKGLDPQLVALSTLGTLESNSQNAFPVASLLDQILIGKEGGKGAGFHIKAL